MGQLSQELVSLFFPVLRVAGCEDVVKIEVEGFFCLIRESIGVFEFLKRKIDDKFCEYLFEELLLMSLGGHRLLR